MVAQSEGAAWPVTVLTMSMHIGAQESTPQELATGNLSQDATRVGQANGVSRCGFTCRPYDRVIGKPVSLRNDNVG